MAGKGSRNLKIRAFRNIFLRLDPQMPMTALHVALSHLEHGDRAAALASLATLPDDPTVLAQAGLLMAQLDDRNGAISALHRAWQLVPGSSELASHLAVLLLDSGQAEQARAVLAHCLTVIGDDAGVLRLAAAICAHPEESETLLRRAIAAAPTDAAGWRDLAQFYLDHGTPDQAISASHQACLLAPNEASSWMVLAQATASGDPATRLNALENATRLQPSNADLLCDLGAARLAAGQPDAALAALDQAIAITPDHAAAHNNRGLALWRLMRPQAALPALIEAARLAPERADILTNLGAVYGDVGQLGQAATHYRQALALDPSYHPALGNLAGVIAETGRIPDADSLFRQAVTMAPHDAELQSGRLFALNSHPDLTGEDLLAAYRDFTAQWLPDRPASPPPAQSREKLRIGYLSPDFKDHPITRIAELVLASHDRDHVSVHCYAEIQQPDSTTERMATQADGWCFTAGMSDDALAERIRADGIDILVDLAGHTRGHRLGVFPHRPAPVSASWMIGTGYSSGMDCIDWYITDHNFLPSGSDHLVAERGICRLPTAYAWAPPAIAPAPGALPAHRRGFITFGSQSRIIRLNEQVLTCWAAILTAVPGSHLRLNTRNLSDPDLCQQLTAFFARHDISPDRIDLTSTSSLALMWRCYLDIDIALDPFPHNGGTVGFDALWMGVPLVSLAARPPLGRFGWSFLHHVDLTDLIATSPTEYIGKAVTLAADRARLASLRASLRSRLRASALTRPRDLARQLEGAYRRMWSVARGDISPAQDPVSGKYLLDQSS